jgi:hypothetical protein
MENEDIVNEGIEYPLIIIRNGKTYLYCTHDTDFIKANCDVVFPTIPDFKANLMKKLN